MRRFKVQVEADFPPEIQRVFEGMERPGNPWGLDQEKRDEWAQDLPIPQWSDGGSYEYLFFVGCAGSYDERQKKVNRAMVKILTEAEVTFATLGKHEMCTGDSARRLGNEYRCQMLAKQNVESWNGLSVKAIITQCPPLLQHHQERVPGLRRQPPGAFTRRADQRVDQRQAGEAVQGDEREAHLPRPLLPGSAQRHLRRSSRGAGRHSGVESD